MCHAASALRCREAELHARQPIGRTALPRRRRGVSHDDGPISDADRRKNYGLVCRARRSPGTCRVCRGRIRRSPPTAHQRLRPQPLGVIVPVSPGEQRRLTPYRLWMRTLSLNDRLPRLCLSICCVCGWGFQAGYSIAMPLCLGDRDVAVDGVGGGVQFIPGHPQPLFRRTVPFAAPESSSWRAANTGSP